MACFGGIIEPLGNGERFLYGTGALLEGERIGGDDGSKIVSFCVDAANIAGRRKGNIALQHGSEISAERAGGFRDDMGYAIALSKATFQIGKFRPITAIFKVENCRICLNHKITPF